MRMRRPLKMSFLQEGSVLRSAVRQLQTGLQATVRRAARTEQLRTSALPSPGSCTDGTPHVSQITVHGYGESVPALQ